MTSPKAPWPMSMLAIMPRSAHCAVWARATVTRGISVNTANQERTGVSQPCIQSISQGTPKL
jgi:hypothetical protein